MGKNGELEDRLVDIISTWWELSAAGWIWFTFSSQPGISTATCSLTPHTFWCLGSQFHIRRLSSCCVMWPQRISIGYSLMKPPYTQTTHENNHKRSQDRNACPDKAKVNWHRKAERWRRAYQCTCGSDRGKGMKNLPHASEAAESTITFTTQALREERKEREGKRHRDDITIFFSLLLSIVD